MSLNSGGVPDWDLEQLEVIMEYPSAYQLLLAGPGTGKTAVACQRVAFLVDEGIPPSRILLVSFTRTAIAEIRDRIVSYAVAGERAKSVRLSTIDSHAWSLRSGCDDEPLRKAFGDCSYDLSIERTIELFRDQQVDLMDFMHRLEHLIIDEAQDVVGIRARLIMEMLRSVNPQCGVTIFADPAQAIYGFTTEEDESETTSVSLLELLESENSRKFTKRRLQEPHRIQRSELREVFDRTRAEVDGSPRLEGHVQSVHNTIRDACENDFGRTPNEDFAGIISRFTDDSTLVLFRRRADVLIASSYCSDAKIEHRLRTSGCPTIVYPWIGWLFGEVIEPIISREQFDDLWARQARRVAAPFEGLTRDECWGLIHRLAAGRRTGTLDLLQLRRLVARSRPPLELCFPESGVKGPILGSIHASKGREADTVLLTLPVTSVRGKDNRQPDAVFEEGRVYYVGATRARKMLFVALKTNTLVSYLESKRIYRRLSRNRVQLEIGREGDVDRLAHLNWTRSPEAQLTLVSNVGRTEPIDARIMPEHDYAVRLHIGNKRADGVTRIEEIGEMSLFFRQELGKIWSIVDTERRLKPAPSIPHLYLAGVTTVGLTEDERSTVGFPYSQSGFALAPVVKGFSVVQFLSRAGRRRE